MSSAARRGKFNKAKRGGGKKFSRDLQPLDKDGNALGMWREPGDAAKAESSSDEDSSSDESSDGDIGSSAKGPQAELTREERKEQQRKKKQAAIAKKNKKPAEVGDLPTSSEEESEDDLDMPANPNHTAKARAQARVATSPSGEATPPKKVDKADKANLSRREREIIEQEEAKARYEKLRAAGQTDEARADLARLRIIRQQREEATARKNAEKEELEEKQKENKERLDKESKKREAAMGGPAAGRKGRKEVVGKK